jgi:hypothetical protein
LRRALELMPQDYLASLARLAASADTTTPPLKGDQLDVADRADRFLRIYQDAGGTWIRGCRAREDFAFYAATRGRTDLQALTAGRDPAVAASADAQITIRIEGPITGTWPSGEQSGNRCPPGLAPIAR